MALKGSSDMVYPDKHHDIEDIEIANVGPTFYDTIGNEDIRAQSYDNLDVAKDISDAVNESYNGLSDLTGNAGSTANAGTAGQTEKTDDNQSCVKIVLGTIGMFLLSTLISVGTGAVVYHISECSKGDASAQILDGNNSTCTQHGLPDNVTDVINDQISQLNDEWNKRMEAANDKHSEVLNNLLDVNRQLLQMVNASQNNENKTDHVPNLCCPEGWLASDTSCYLFVRNKKSSFASAELYCRQQHNSYLVEVETRAENNFLKDHMKGLKTAHHWLGLTDIRKEGTWRWYASDTVASFTNWNKGQPGTNSGEEDCAAFWYRVNYNWADVPCGLKLSPVCEMRKT